MPSEEAHQEIVVTVADDCPDIDRLAQRLAAKGLSSPNILSGVGLIVGHGRADLAETLRAEPGVSGVELTEGVQIPPPESPVQ
jgi:hypothetical protein